MSVSDKVASLPITGYFVATGPDKTPPKICDELSINWCIAPTNGASIFHAVNYQIIVTTNSGFARLCQDFIVSSETDHRQKPILVLDGNDESTWSKDLHQLLLKRLPVQCLGPMSDRGAHLADHIFFAPPSLPLYELLLLNMGSTDTEIRRRFRQWSIHLHPDRFETQKNLRPTLAARMHTVYDRVCEAYRTLGDPYKRAIHNYWLNVGQPHRAAALNESTPIAEINHLHESPIIRAQLIDALGATEVGHWTTAVDNLRTICAVVPDNRRLKKFIATLGQISRFIEQEDGNTSLN
jgi:hypothetical protein